ncbi:MAG: outer membrane beta-barrel protein [Hyphomicrobiales bacterium]|nr:outer membrane beta-barrel protein [Hyphomicrobiales bacterium]
MKIKFLAATALVASFIAGSALASDLPARVYKGAPPAPVAVPAFSWTGFYLGADAGWSRLDSVSADSVAGSATNIVNGFAIGALAGYNYEFSGGFVVGAELDGTYVTGRHTTTLGAIAVRAGQEWTDHARLRLGYAFDRALLYVAGGYTYADDNILFSGGASGSGPKSLNGYNLGVGVDYAVNDNWVVRLEYIHDQFGNRSFATSAPSTVRQKTSDDMVRAALIYKF